MALKFSKNHGDINEAAVLFAIIVAGVASFMLGGMLGIVALMAWAFGV